jgi:hypothetical protein
VIGGWEKLSRQGFPAGSFGAKFALTTTGDQKKLLSDH